jgi:two-component system, LytTR family, sensor kinase
VTTAPQRPSPNALFWRLQLGGWLAFGASMALSRLGRYPLDYMIATKVALAASGLAVSLLLRVLYRRWAPESATVVRTVVVTAGLSFLGALVWTPFYNLVDARIATHFLDREIEIQNATQLFSASLYHAFILLAWSVLYVGIKRHEALHAERERLVRIEAMAHHAQLQALRFQLQPHFLFNSLNALSTLIVERRTDEASRMLSRISDFLRHTLAGPDSEEVSVAQELDFARRYLEIEQVRFGDRLRVRLDVPDDVQDAAVPNMLLQPLLENAVRHAIAPGAGGTIGVTVRRESDRLRVLVTDTGPGSVQGNGNGASGGVGLANTQARLTQVYGAAHRLTAGRTPAGGFTVNIELPFRRTR